jgi:hypothetical protein
VHFLHLTSNEVHNYHMFLQLIYLHDKDPEIFVLIGWKCILLFCCRILNNLCCWTIINWKLHLVDQSPWPIEGAGGAFILVSGLLQWFHLYDMSLFWLNSLQGFSIQNFILAQYVDYFGTMLL